MTNLATLKKEFKNKDLFDLALTHRSWVNEHKGLRQSNERLEFLGDAILEFVVSKQIYEDFPKEEEGYLTALRANLVNTASLAGVAEKLGLGPLLFLSRGEEDGGGRSNTSLLADTVEAIIGAIFIDRGSEDAEKFISENLLKEIDKRLEGSLKDSKSSLQEYVQGLGLPAPKYIVLEEFGPDHDKKFVISVQIGDVDWGKGTGKSKSAAQQDAAKNALQTHVAKSA